MVGLLTKQSCVLDNQSSPSIEAIANNHVSTSHYMSSKKQNERYEEESNNEP